MICLLHLLHCGTNFLKLLSALKVILNEFQKICLLLLHLFDKNVLLLTNVRLLVIYRAKRAIIMIEQSIAEVAGILT